MRVLWRLPLLLFGLLVLAAAAIPISMNWSNTLPEGAALRVGDTVVTEQQYRERVHVLEALYGLKSPSEGSKSSQFEKDAAKSIVVSMILDHAARERGVHIADKQVRDVLTEIISRHPGGHDAFTEFLGSNGISERDVMDEVRRQLATSRLFDKVTAAAGAVSDADVRREYERNRDRMTVPEQRRLRNIVVRSREDADTVVAKARAGTDFATLARIASLDGSTKNQGGDLGYVTENQLAPGFAKAAFAAPRGSVFGPVRARFGWNVGQVVAIKPGRPLSFDQVKERLEVELRNKRQLDIWRNWLASQIEAADVQYADRYRPADPDAPPMSAP